LHVLIAADTDQQIAVAQAAVEDILFNPETAMKLKQEQLRQ
jgi:far upstream element-binding protein